MACLLSLVNYITVTFLAFNNCIVLVVSLLDSIVVPCVTLGEPGMLKRSRLTNIKVRINATSQVCEEPSLAHWHACDDQEIYKKHHHGGSNLPMSFPKNQVVGSFSGASSARSSASGPLQLAARGTARGRKFWRCFCATVVEGEQDQSYGHTAVPNRWAIAATILSDGTQGRGTKS